jgi:hypothetical protein
MLARRSRLAAPVLPSGGSRAVRDQRAVRSEQAVDGAVENRGESWGWIGGPPRDDVWEHNML